MPPLSLFLSFVLPMKKGRATKRSRTSLANKKWSVLIIKTIIGIFVNSAKFAWLCLVWNRFKLVECLALLCRAPPPALIPSLLCYFCIANNLETHRREYSPLRKYVTVRMAAFQFYNLDLTASLHSNKNIILFWSMPVLLNMRPAVQWSIHQRWALSAHRFMVMVSLALIGHVIDLFTYFKSVINYISTWTEAIEEALLPTLPSLHQLNKRIDVIP